MAIHEDSCLKHLHASLTHSFPMHLFSSPWKHWKTLPFLGVAKGCIGNEWVKDMAKKSKLKLCVFGCLSLVVQILKQFPLENAKYKRNIYKTVKYKISIKFDKNWYFSESTFIFDPGSLVRKFCTIKTRLILPK